MLRLAIVLRLPGLLLAVALASPAAAETLFARIDTDMDGQPQALQLGIATYVRDDISVDLVSAIHIGDSAYYADLNERFRTYNALLFELIAPEGIDISAQVSNRRGLLSSAQIGLTRLLDLTFQLDEIDYSQPNFVHADLTPTALRAQMKARNESLYTYFWRVFFASVNEYAQDPLGLRDWQMLSSMVGTGEDAPLKTLIAYEMTNIEQVQDILGDDSGSAIVGARNERAIEVLHEQLDAGSKRLGIFFGVAHMPDLEARLEDMGFSYSTTVWVDAWRLD